MKKKIGLESFGGKISMKTVFSGEIDYSFGNIINLSYFINFNSRSKLPVESNTISGEIATEKGIKKCTLVGKLILPSQQYGSLFYKAVQTKGLSVMIFALSLEPVEKNFGSASLSSSSNYHVSGLK